MAPGRAPLGLRVAAFTLLVPGTVIGLVPWLMLRHAGDGRSFRFEGIGWFGAAAAALGLAIYSWCAWEFAARGRGTPAVYDPPRHLVVSGLYRRVRNPMYVGVLLALAGEALLSRSTSVAVYASALALVFHLHVVLREEPALRRSFPGDFAAYCAGVRRWLPRWRAWRASVADRVAEEAPPPGKATLR